MAANAEYHRNENVYKQVELQEAEERRLRDDELERMRLQWLEQMRVRPSELSNLSFHRCCLRTTAVVGFVRSDGGLAVILVATGGLIWYAMRCGSDSALLGPDTRIVGTS